MPWPFRRRRLGAIAGKLSDRQLVDKVFDRRPDRLEKCTAIQWGVHRVWWLVAEQQNGSIEQYFTNSTADDYPALCEFLEQVGARATLDALAPFAESFFAGDNFMGRDARIDLVTARREQDEPAWEASVGATNDEVESSLGDLYRKVAAHIRDHIDEVEGA